MVVGLVLNIVRKAMQRYYEKLRRKLDELRIDVYTFFRVAHVHQFGTDPDMSNQVAQWKMHAVIPKFVCDYLDYIGEE